MIITNDRLQEALRHAKLLWIISRSHKVTFKKGKGWTCRCPACKKETLNIAIDDKSYSCINPECCAAGNAINWIASLYGLHHTEALIILEQLNTADDRTPEFEIEYPPQKEKNDGKKGPRLHVAPTQTDG